MGSVGAQPTERRLRLDRPDRRPGPGGRAGPAVVFIHGANTSGTSWAALAARLPGFRCILVDRPGTGLSQPPATPSTQRRLPAFGDALVVDVLDALDLPTASVVATSFGGYVALRTAAAHADRVDRMVLFSWSAGLPVARLPVFMRLMTAPGLGRLAAAMPQNERSVRMRFRGSGHGPRLEAGGSPEDIDCYLALVRHTDTMRNELALGRALIKPPAGWTGSCSRTNARRDPCADAPAVGRERSVRWGDEARRLVARLPNAELVLLQGAGHAPWLDDLDGCARPRERSSPSAPRLDRGSVLLRMRLAILRLRPLHDVERLGDRAAVLVGGALEVLVGDVGFAHVEVGVHAATGQAHR